MAGGPGRPYVAGLMERGSEYHAGDPPATPPGVEDAEFWDDRRPLARAA